MTRKFVAKPLAVAVGVALAMPAMAVEWSLKESNIYMKFLDGNQRAVASNSVDTASGADQGQFTELNLQVRGTINPQVEAGFRVQSRSSAAYWSEFGFKDEDNPDKTMNSRKFMKLRGAYIQLTPGYGWLNEVRIGSSQWAMFDPFTVGAMRYIDRDNINGFYFRGRLGTVTWDAARITMPEYLGFNWGNGPKCCGTDTYQKGEATYIAQVRVPIGGARLAASAQTFNDRNVDASDPDPLNGRNLTSTFKNNVYSLKGEGSPVNGVDLKGAYYRSISTLGGSGVVGEGWNLTPNGNVSDNAYKFDVGFNALPIQNLTLNYQYFNIGEGYFSINAARRESDVLLTEGSESAWYNWGANNLWLGGSAADTYQQVVHRGVDNDFMDFNERPAERVIGWKGHTVVANYEVVDTPMSFEYSRIGYNNNWQGYSGPLSNWYALNQDRKTNIGVFKANHTFRLLGGLDTGFKYKWVRDTDGVNSSIGTDDIETKDRGYSFMVGNQLHNHLYGSLSWGRYSRKIHDGSSFFDNDKDILSAKFTYSLGGFEFGVLSQWIDGTGDPMRTGTRSDFKQYRLKATAQATF